MKRCLESKLDKRILLLPPFLPSFPWMDCISNFHRIKFILQVFPRGSGKKHYWKTFQSIKDLWLLSVNVFSSWQGWNRNRNLRAVKRDFRALRQLVEGSGAQVVILSILSVPRNNIDRNRQIHQVSAWLWGWYNWKNWVFWPWDDLFNTWSTVTWGDMPFSKGKKNSSTGASKGSLAELQLGIWKYQSC